MPISVVVKGRYFAIQKFARLLRQSADIKNGKLAGKGRLYTIDSIAFAGAGSCAARCQPANGAILATLALNAFTYSAAAPPAAATSTDTSTTSSDSTATAAGATP